MVYKVISLGNLITLVLGITFMPRCGLEPDRSEPCSVLSSLVLLFSHSSVLFVTRPYLMLRKKVPES